MTYTTLGHEPFSIHNILDQDVWQVTNNFTLFSGRHSSPSAGTSSTFAFFNSFNIFRHGLFFLPPPPASGAFSSLQDFLDATDPANPNRVTSTR